MIVSGYISLGVQFFTGLVDLWGLTLPLDPKDKIYKELLALELVVQTIEFCFYIWLVLNLHREDITMFRYYDWFLTTPFMLITLMAFISPEPSLSIFFHRNSSIISTVVLLNALMLLCGWKAEKQPWNSKTWIAWGFLFWVMTFGYIFTHFYPASKHPLFSYYLVIWGIYGIAAVLPYRHKNNMYNILDLFSKNALGIYLTYVIYKKSETYVKDEKRRGGLLR